MMTGKYDGYRLQAPDNSFLGFCSKSKFDWYIKQNLVEKVNDTTIKLNFEPKIKGQYKRFDDFYNHEHAIQCVVCGSKDDLIRFHIIPLEFRRHFPEEMKSHACHDILLLCNNCHYDANYVYGQYRQHLFVKFNLVGDPVFRKLKNYAGSYLRQKKKNNIKTDQNICVKKLIEYFGHDPSINELEVLSNHSAFVCMENDTFQIISNVGEYIVKKYSDNDSLLKFEEKWRKMFVDNMEPEFLPEHW